MTVRAEEPEVHQPVVVALAVHMVERHVDRLAAPLGESALLTPVLLDAGP
jgi:hypothetical protein